MKINMVAVAWKCYAPLCANAPDAVGAKAIARAPVMRVFTVFYYTDAPS